MTKSLKFDCQFEYPSGFQLNAKFTTTKQVTAITGPSGSGKTTILYLLTGLLRPGRGTISLGDRELSSSESGRSCGRNSGESACCFRNIGCFLICE